MKTLQQWVDYHYAELKKDKKYEFASEDALMTLAVDMANKSFTAQQSGSKTTSQTPSPLPSPITKRVGVSGVVAPTAQAQPAGSYNDAIVARIQQLGTIDYANTSVNTTPDQFQFLGSLTKPQLQEIQKVLKTLGYNVKEVGALKRTLSEYFAELFPSKDYAEFYNKLKARQITGEEGGADRKTPATTLVAEISQAFNDYFDSPIDDKTAKEYANRVRAAENASPSKSISTLERSNILLDIVQKRAAEVYKQSVASGDSSLLEQGALGQTFQQIRNAYDKYGIEATNKQLSQLAMNGIRSKQALENIMGKIQLQAEIAFPALKEYLKQGLTTRDALATHIGMYSKVYNIPENQVKISDLYDAFSEGKLVSPTDWKRILFTKPEFKNTETYQNQLMSDAEYLKRNFLG